MPVHENTNAQRHQPPGRRPTGEAQRFGLGTFLEYSVSPQFVKQNYAVGSLAVPSQRKQLGSQRKVALVRLWRCAVVVGVRVIQAFTFKSQEWDEFHDHARQSMLSGVVISDRSARSIWSWRNQSWIAAALTPSSTAAVVIGLLARTSATARIRNSAGKGLGMREASQREPDPHIISGYGTMGHVKKSTKPGAGPTDR